MVRTTRDEQPERGEQLSHLNDVAESTLRGWLALAVLRRDEQHIAKLRNAILRRLFERARAEAR